MGIPCRLCGLVGFLHHRQVLCSAQSKSQDARRRRSPTPIGSVSNLGTLSPCLPHVVSFFGSLSALASTCIHASPRLSVSRILFHPHSHCLALFYYSCFRLGGFKSLILKRSLSSSFRYASTVPSTHTPTF